MNIAVIYAGGLGSRLHNYSRPKQFIEFRGKPVVIYTIEIFQHIPDVDGIVVVCLNDWIGYLRNEVEKYHLEICPTLFQKQYGLLHVLLLQAFHQ